ncbi:hypothetical protein M0D44_07870 [Xanthomonas prunicola]|nr:hypothetical protein [Xanthomonas prunicola]UXA50415.1 hypothetical protein M0D44_07870 [Xanthomonas prunicola]
MNALLLSNPVAGINQRGGHGVRPSDAALQQPLESRTKRHDYRAIR